MILWKLLQGGWLTEMQMICGTWASYHRTTVLLFRGRAAYLSKVIRLFAMKCGCRQQMLAWLADRQAWAAAGKKWCKAG